jgi:hypothetical protein
MKVRFRKGMVTITLSVIDPPRLSSSGKTLLVATSRGVRKTSLRTAKKSVYVNANAFIRTDQQPTRRNPQKAKRKVRSKGAKSHHDALKKIR